MLSFIRSSKPNKNNLTIDRKESCWRRLYEKDLRKENPFELSKTTMCAFSPKIPEDDAYLTQKKFTILLIGVHLGPPTGK